MTNAIEVLVNGPTDLTNKVKVDSGLRPLDPSKCKVTKTQSPKSLPEDMKFTFGATFTDHMLICEFDPEVGWLDPEIKPYGPLAMDPASACLHYAPALFEGMKAYKSDEPGSNPILFRPDMNMARMRNSADRVQLPDFDGDAMTELIAKLVKLDEHLIPAPPNALYIRPTMIGTRPTLGVAPSSHAMIFVILSPVGPFFPTKPPSAPALPVAGVENVAYTNGSSASPSNGTNGTHDTIEWSANFQPVSLLATTSATRAWPGGAGAYKLAGNYAPCFKPQTLALAQGYQQNLWCLEGNDGRTKVTECGQMNMMIVTEIKRDGDIVEVEIATPELDGTILPGVTRDSVLSLFRAHASPKNEIDTLPHLPSGYKVTVSERAIYLDEVIQSFEQGKILEVFGTGTAAVICPIKRIGREDGSPDLHVPEYSGGLGPMARAVFERIAEIQQGKVAGHPWAVSI